MSSVFEFNIDLAIEYVKRLYENILCAICDKPDLPRFRFSCGHSLCENCINASVGCYICFISPETSSVKPQYDAVLTKQVKNVSRLMNAFKEAFNVDVYKRKRISEYLKIEKELFPQCIQAPQKYYNKRKSYNKSYYTGKENYQTKFLGEDISPVRVDRMENTVNYVQNWLNKNGNNRKRKPLGDINLENVDIKRKSGTLNQKNISALNVKGYVKGKRKIRKTTFKTTSESENTLDIRDVKREQNSQNIPMKRNNESYKEDIREISNAYEKDESGIVIDDDTSSLIENSQLSTDYDESMSKRMVDKDEKALLEAIKASKNEHDSVLDNRGTSIIVGTKKGRNKMDGNNEFHQHNKVPYYKMSYLKETCYLCSKDVCVENKAKYESKVPSKDICVTIDKNNYEATITVTNNIQNFKNIVDMKISKSVQTDIVEVNNSYYYNNEKELGNDPLKDNNLLNKPLLVTKLIDVQSQDLFTSENPEEAPADKIDKKILNDHNTEFKNRRNVIIEESDSSEDMEESRVLEVTADIHRTCEQLDYDILTKVENIEEHSHRPRRRPRGHTPDSSNSSDKENYDPNRSKRLNNSKKVCCKK